jgi:PAS domain S-box-containing protein
VSAIFRGISISRRNHGNQARRSASLNYTPTMIALGLSAYGVPDRSAMDELREITQQLLRFSPDALIVVDERGTIRFASDTVTELFGYAPGALVGQSMDVLVPERLRSRHTDHVSSFLMRPSNREMGARISDLAARRSDGSEFSAGIRLSPFKIGEKLFVAAAIRDISERQRINEALVAAREEADRANRAKSRFLATASHDLRQPLQTIRLYNAAMFKVADAGTRELLQHQANAIDTMARLLNALLDISRLESGAIEPQPVNVSVGDVLAELKAEFSEAARARGLRFDATSTPAVISTDRTLFYQLLQNVVGNAVKYTDRGAITVTCVPDAQGLAIEVMDTGIGIPDDKLERIFDEYYQVDTHGAKRMGVGLGLAIVREVARLLGVHVKVSSRVGEGTRVRIQIPQKSIVSLAPEARSAGPTNTPQSAQARSRLVLVEDNDAVRTATQLFLKLEGYEVSSAASIAEAEPLFESMTAGDVVVADYHLDDKHTGLDMLMQVRERLGYEVPGIVLSGDLPSVLRSVRIAVPSCVFLSKPVDTVALVHAIDELSAASKQNPSLLSAAQVSGR